jgi:MFS family permease
MLDTLTPVAQKHFRRNYLLGIGNGVFFNLAGAFLNLSTVLPAFVAHLSRSPILIGLAGSLEPAGWFLPQLFTGHLVEHRVRKKPVYIQMAFVRVGTLAALAITPLLLRESAPTVLLLAFFLLYSLYSLAGGVAGMAFFDIVGKAIPSRKRGTMWAWRLFLGGIAAALAGLLVSDLLARYPFPVNYAIIFWCGTAAVAVGTIIFSFAVEPVEPVRKEKRTFRAYLGEGNAIFRNDSDFRSLLATRVMLGVATMAGPFFIVFGIERLGFSEESAGLFLTVQMLGLILSNLLWGWMSNHRGSRLILQTISLGSLIMPSVPVLLSFVALPRLTYLLVFFVLGASVSGTRIGHANALLDIAPPLSRPTYLGLMNTLIAPSLVFPVIGGFIVSATSYHVLFLLSGVGAVLAFLQASRLRLAGVGPGREAAGADAQQEQR